MEETASAEAVACRLRIGAVEADLGIPMGTGTEVAIQSAGVTFVKGNLAGILLSPGVAALAMSLSSVSVIGNALCLRTARP